MRKFHFDEGVPSSFLDAAKDLGVDVTNSRTAQLTGACDREHLLYAAKKGRVFVTFDSDFDAYRDEFEGVQIVVLDRRPSMAEFKVLLTMIGD